jgi:hypothetical protein
MEYRSLRERSILLVGHEGRLAMEIITALEGAGAYVAATASVHNALLLAEHDDGLSAIVVDDTLSESERTRFYEILGARGIPCVCHGDYNIDDLMQTLEALLLGSLPRSGA